MSAPFPTPSDPSHSVPSVSHPHPWTRTTSDQVLDSQVDKDPRVTPVGHTPVLIHSFPKRNGRRRSQGELLSRRT